MKKGFRIGAYACWCLGGAAGLGGLTFVLCSYFLARMDETQSVAPSAVFLYLIPFVALAAILIGAGAVLWHYGTVARSLTEGDSMTADTETLTDAESETIIETSERPTTNDAEIETNTSYDSEKTDKT